MMRFLAALVACVLATAVTAQEYRLGSGDVLAIEVLEDSTLNRQVPVLPDGSITFPFAGTLRAEGRTVSDLTRALTSALSPTFAVEPTVFVTLASVAPQSFQSPGRSEIAVYFIGEVQSPGRVILPSNTTLLQALASAGGFTDFAATKRIQLRRVDPASGQERVYAFDYRSASRGAVSAGSTRLREGDVILVPERRLFE